MYVTVNGTNITETVMIFQDEIPAVSISTQNINNIPEGVLVCHSQSKSGVVWHYRNNEAVGSEPSSTFKEIQYQNDDSISLLTRRNNTIDTNERSSGLWFCRLNERLIIEEFVVGIFRRGDE